MSAQTFTESVRESRLFYRRRLAERLAVAQMRTTGGVHVEVVTERAKAVTAALAAIEDAELKAREAQ